MFLFPSRRESESDLTDDDFSYFCRRLCLMLCVSCIPTEENNETIILSLNALSLPVLTPASYCVLVFLTTVYVCVSVHFVHR